MFWKACMVMTMMIAVTTEVWADVREWPAREVKITVPQGPGSASDAVARVWARELQELWGQRVLVENRPGASGAINYAGLAKSAPDGYTITMINTTFTAGLASQTNLPYTRDQILGVGQFARFNVLMIARGDAAFNDIPQLLRHLRDNPGRVRFGNIGYGSYGHLTMKHLEGTLGTRMISVPYANIAQAVPDLVSGQIDLMITDMLAPFPGMLAKGEIKIIGTLGDPWIYNGQRVASITQFVPNVRANGYYALGVPKDTPRAIVERIQRDMAKITANADVQQKLISMHLVPVTISSEEFNKWVDSDIDKLRRLIRDFDIKPD